MMYILNCKNLMTPFCLGTWQRLLSKSHSATAHSWALRKTLIVAKLVKKSPALHGIPRFTTSSQKHAKHVLHYVVPVLKFVVRRQISTGVLPRYRRQILLSTTLSTTSRLESRPSRGSHDSKVQNILEFNLHKYMLT
jgi:hypothetical protein